MTMKKTAKSKVSSLEARELLRDVLSECRVDQVRDSGGVTKVVVTHLPTGTVAEGLPPKGHLYADVASMQEKAVEELVKKGAVKG